MSEPLTLTLKTASEKTGLSKKVLSGLLKEGRIQGSKPGKEVLIYWDSLKKHLLRHTIKSA
jgi:excisionase family DNA binding protein